MRRGNEIKVQIFPVPGMDTESGEMMACYVYSLHADEKVVELHCFCLVCNPDERRKLQLLKPVLNGRGH